MKGRMFIICAVPPDLLFEKSHFYGITVQPGNSHAHRLQCSKECLTAFITRCLSAKLTPKTPHLINAIKFKHITILIATIEFHHEMI